MSLSQVFQPNSYDLFCNSLTAAAPSSFPRNLLTKNFTQPTTVIADEVASVGDIPFTPIDTGVASTVKITISGAQLRKTGTTNGATARWDVLRDGNFLPNNQSAGALLEITGDTDTKTPALVVYDSAFTPGTQHVYSLSCGLAASQGAPDTAITLRFQMAVEQEFGPNVNPDPIP